MPGPYPRAADSVGVEWSPTAFVSNRFYGAADAAGLGTVVWESVFLLGDKPMGTTQREIYYPKNYYPKNIFTSADMDIQQNLQLLNNV